SVQRQQRQPAGRLTRTGHPVPGLEPLEGNAALGRGGGAHRPATLARPRFLRQGGPAAGSGGMLITDLLAEVGRGPVSTAREASPHTRFPANSVRAHCSAGFVGTIPGIMRTSNCRTSGNASAPAGVVVR